MNKRELAERLAAMREEPWAPAVKQWRNPDAFRAWRGWPFSLGADLARRLEATCTRDELQRMHTLARKTAKSWAAQHARKGA